jgi:hypothetical protein
MESSAYTKVALNPGKALLSLAIAGAAVGLLDRSGIFGHGE